MKKINNSNNNNNNKRNNLLPKNDNTRDYSNVGFNTFIQKRKIIIITTLHKFNFMLVQEKQKNQQCNKTAFRFF